MSEAQLIPLDGIQKHQCYVCSPPYNDFLQIDLLMQIEHCLVVFHVDSNLFQGLAVEDRKGIAHINIIFCAHSEEGTNDMLLRVFAPEEVI